MLVWFLITARDVAVCHCLENDLEIDGLKVVKSQVLLQGARLLWQHPVCSSDNPERADLGGSGQGRWTFTEG